MNEEIKEKTVILPPFKHFIMTVGAIPTSYLESMTYYEMLVWFTNYLGKTVIPAINENGEAVTELQNLFRELQDYVNNYFDNLDVQEEINNKLDNMVEEGTLQEIIADYLNSKAIFGFDTVASMKSSTNLIDGSYAKTLGYYAVNDGGGATYKISNQLPNTYYEELDSNLYAILCFDDIVNVKQFGAYGNNVDDDTTKIQTAINTGRTVFIPNGNYKVSSSITISTENQKIYSDTNAIICPTIALDLFYLNNARINININVDGQYQTTTDNTRGIIVIGHNNINSALCTLNRCQFSSLKQTAIVWEQGSMIQFNNCNIFGATGYGLYATTVYNDNNHGLLNNFRITNCDIGVYLEPTSTITMGSQFNVFNNVKCFGCRQNFKIGTVYNYGTIFSEDSTDADELTSESYGNEFIYMGDQTESSRAVDNGRNTISFYTQSSSRTYKDVYFKNLRLKYGSGADGYRELSNTESRVYNDTIIGSNTVNVNYTAQTSSGNSVIRNDNFKNVTADTTTTGKIKVGTTELSTQLERIYKGSISVGAVTFTAGETKTYNATYLGVNCVVLASGANGNPTLVFSASNYSGSTKIYVTNVSSDSVTTNGSFAINYVGIY